MVKKLASMQRHPQAWIGLLIFLACCVVYLLNERTISSNDNIPHSMLAFNWLVNHSLNFDAFRGTYLYGDGGECLRCGDTNTPYFLVEAPNGHLTSTYPIGTAIVTFPLYALYVVYLKLAGALETLISGVPTNFLNLTDESFNPFRKDLEKLSGTIVTALSVVMFYFATRLKFSPTIALSSTFIFAFCTSSWSLVSQGLRQHTVGNLLVVAILLCLLKAQRTTGRAQIVLLVIAGFFCGLMPGVRLPNALYSVAIALFVLLTYRQRFLFFALGSLSFLFNALWNVYFFGFSLKTMIVGGYSSLFSGGSSSYRFDLEYVTTAFWGLLISPSDGLLTYSPILLLAIPGAVWVYRLRHHRDEQLVGSLAIAAGVLFLHYSIYVPWTGGAESFGSRLMTDVVPITAFLISYPLAQLEITARSQQKLATRVVVGLIAGLTIISIAIQGVGSFIDINWGTVPVPLLGNPGRLWQLRDTEIERSFKGLFSQLSNPIGDKQAYLDQVDGEILQVQSENAPAFSSSASQITLPAQKRLVLSATLKNTGKVRWYGYQTGLERGETRMRCKFFDAQGTEVKTGYPNMLYVSGIVEPGDNAQALGQIRAPRRQGDFTFSCALTVERMGEFPQSADKAYSIPVQIRPRVRNPQSS